MSHCVPLSLIIVKNAVLDPRHLDFVIDALNHQTDSRFNTFWIDQSPDPAPLQAQLESASFAWQAFHSPGPVVAGVSCWELVHPFALLLAQPAMGRYFSYLHMECLPETDFVATILATLPEVEAQCGERFICMLQQLWSPLELGDLHPRHFLEQIRHDDLFTWTPEARVSYADYRRYSFAWFEQPWQEDAFLMPVALARELQLYSAVQAPLYFQDVFDIFPLLAPRPFARGIRWVRLPRAVIYHLQHPRPFLEFRRAFLDGVRAHPELFAHLGLYDAALGQTGYLETAEMRHLGTVSDELLYFYRQLRYGPRGCATLWLEALDSAHGQVSET